MPLHLEPIDVSGELGDCKSVLVVSCPVCPPVSLVTDKDTPLIEFFKHGIKTPAYEAFIDKVRESLEKEGIKTDTFTSYLPCAATCLWTSGQRNRLRKRARDYDAALVMGCESARVTVEETLKDSDCRTILGMELVGITNATLKFGLPLTVRLENLARVNANERDGAAPQLEEH